MKRSLRRALGILLALSLLVGLLPMAVSADPATPETLRYNGAEYRLISGGLYTRTYKIGTTYLIAAQSGGAYYALGAELDAVRLVEEDGALVPKEQPAVPQQPNELPVIPAEAAALLELEPVEEDGRKRITDSLAARTADGKAFCLNADDSSLYLSDTQPASVTRWWASDDGGFRAWLDGDRWNTYRYLHYDAAAGRFIVDDAGTAVLIYQKVCDHSGRAETSAKTPTCTEAGCLAHAYCPACGSWLDAAGNYTYTDGQGDEYAYTEGSFFLPATGHCYVDGVCLNDPEHLARSYELVTSDEMIVPGDDYRYLIVAEDGKTIGLDGTKEYDNEMLTCSGTEPVGSGLRIDNSADPAGVFAAELRLTDFAEVNDDPGLTLPQDGAKLYAPSVDEGYGMLLMGELRFFSTAANGDAKYPIGITIENGYATIHSWNYGSWGAPVVYDAATGFALANQTGWDDPPTFDRTSNVRLYRSVNEGAEPAGEMPEYCTVDGERFRLLPGLTPYATDGADDPLNAFVIVGRSGVSYCALDRSGSGVTVSALTLTDGELSGSAVVLRRNAYDEEHWEDYSAGLYDRADGTQLKLYVTDDATGAGSFRFGGKQPGTVKDELDFFGDPKTGATAFRYCRWDADNGVSYGDQAWFLLLSGGAFRASARQKASEEAPAGSALYLYQKVCEHPNKVRTEDRAPTCTEGGLRTFYECPACGLLLDGELKPWRDREDSETGEAAYYSFADFYEYAPLGHDYDTATGICSRCGEKAPVYRKITSLDEILPGRRYLIIENENGLALDVPRPTPTDTGWDVPELLGKTVQTVALEDDQRTVYGSGGAAFYLDTETTNEGWKGERAFAAEVERRILFVADYSWIYPSPLQFADRTVELYELARENAIQTSENELPVIPANVQIDENWCLYFSFLSNGDAGIHFFDSAHPISFDEQTDYGFTLRDEPAWEEQQIWDDELGEYRTDPETGEYLMERVEYPTGVSLWREVREGDPEPGPVHAHVWSEDWSHDETHHWHECTAAGCELTENADKDGYAAHSFGPWTENTEDATYEGHYRECTVCGFRETGAHEWNEGEVTTAPTCAAAGVKTYTCGVCGATKTEPVDPTGQHTPGEPVKECETPPSCTEPGGYDMVVYCTVCHAELSRDHTDVPAISHSFGPWTENTEDATYEGHYRECTVCGFRETGAHEWNEGEVTTAPTCAAAGVKTYTCGVCGATKTEPVDPTGQHTPGEPVRERETPPSCTEPGGYDMAVYCTVCHAELSREHYDIPAPGHDYQPVVTAPTPTEGGYTTWTCSRCKDSYVDSYTDPLGYDYTVTFSVLGDTSAIAPVVCNTVTGITLPAAEAPAGYTFLGWVEQDYDNVTVLPETVLTGAYTAESDVTLLALYTYNDYGGNPPTLELMSTEDTFSDGDKIVIVESGGEHGLYQKAHNYAYVSNFAFTEDAEAILADELKYFNVTEVDGGWYLGDETNGWLYTPDNQTNLTIRNNTAFMTAFTLTTLDGHLALSHTVSYNDNVFYVNCGTNLTGALTNKWRMVNANNMSGISTLNIYKLHEGGPATVCYTTVLRPPHEHTPGEPVMENEVPATCTEPGGYDTVVYCTACGAELSREHTEIPATDHDWGEPTYQWAEDYSACTATRVCKRDESHVETETVQTSSAVTKPATVEEEGEIIYTAVFKNEAFGMREIAVPIPKLEPPTPVNPFDDVKDSAYYYEPVLWAVNHDPQITNGTGAATFSPEDTCTRGQVVTFLWRAKGCPEPTSTENPFKDVKDTDYFYKAVLWAKEADVTTGTDATHFSPNDGCTRAQVVTFLWRAEGEPVPTSTENPFKDVPKNEYYTNAVLWAVEKGITNGTDPGKFSPNATCTRGQIVTFLYRDMA